jgi:hypothetical protein
MSAFGGNADMTLRGNPLSRSLSGVKRTWVDALQMSAFDPKRTSASVQRSVTEGTIEPFQAAAWRPARGR